MLRHHTLRTSTCCLYVAREEKIAAVAHSPQVECYLPEKSPEVLRRALLAPDES